MSKFRKEPASNLNIIVIGATGCGKTMFIRTLCERLKEDRVQGSFRESSPRALQGPLEPTQELYSVSMQLEQSAHQKTTSFTIIDTQGLVKGAALTHQLGFLAKYIDHQLERSLIEESKVKRNTKAYDTRLHACLYFINAPMDDGLCDMDRLAIEMLSSRVNVIPIIGKADTLSTRQLARQKAIFRRHVFDIYKIPLYGLVSLDGDDDDDDYSNDDEDNGGAPFTPTDINKGLYLSPTDPTISEDENSQDSMTLEIVIAMLQHVADKEANDDARAMVDYLKNMPLVVIGYEEDSTTGQPLVILADEMDTGNDSNVAGGTILGRIYPWAVVDCCDPTFCDLERLIDLLFSSHGEMLRLDTLKRFYEQYRIDQLLSQRVDDMVSVKSKANQQQSIL